MTFVKTRKFSLCESKTAYEQGDIYPIWAGIDRPKPGGPGLAALGSLIWGTCLGFERMIVPIAQEGLLKPCQAKDKCQF